MRKLAVAVPLLLACLCGCKPDLDELLARHFEAMGGLERRKAIQTVRVTQRVESGNASNDFEFVIMRKRGNKFRMEDGSSVSGCDGRTSWLRFANQPAKTGGGSCDGPADIDSLLETYKEKALSIEFAGREKVEGQELIHLKLSGQNRRSLHFYLDSHSLLLSRIVSEGNGTHQEDVYSDYRKVDGTMVPFCDEMRWWKVEDDPTGEDRAAAKKIGEVSRQKQVIKTIEYNVPLDDSLFAFPANNETGNL